MITCQFSLSGIKELKVVYYKNYGEIEFPIYPYINPLTGKIKIYDNGTTMNFELYGITYIYLDLTTNFNSFTEQLFEDEKGRYYEHTLNLSSVLDSNLTTLLEHKHVFIMLTDANNNKFIWGYRTPSKLISYNYSSGVIGDGADKYDIVYSSKSYDKLKQYELV